jgi:hypothetical protein
MRSAVEAFAHWQRIAGRLWSRRMSVAFNRSWTVLVVAALTSFAHGQRAGSLAADRAASTPKTPFTAEFRITRIQALSNGVTITRETREVIARDTEGRNMRATTVLTSAAESPDTTVSVFDPTNGEQITWSTLGKRAHVLKTPVGDQQRGCWSTPSGNATSRFGDAQQPASRMNAPASAEAGTGSALTPHIQSAREDLAREDLAREDLAREDVAREDLGADTIMGLQVEGTRTTRTIPAGQIGNDQPLVRISESWRAPNLGLALRQVTDDPQNGKTTRELVGLDLNEPSPATFQPPAGFKVVTEEMHQVACPTAP